MLILPLEEARVGMTLAAPVTHPEHPDQDLLKNGYVLEGEVIKRLRDLGITAIYVEYPGLDELDRHIAVNLSPARQKLYSQIKSTVASNQKRTKPGVSYADYYANTRDLILTLMCQGQHPVYIEHMSGMGDHAIAHATTVAHLGLLLGIKLELYLIQQRRRLPPSHAKEVVNIGVAGMLHDMGKLSLPPELQKYNGVYLPETPELTQQWEEHTHKGYDMIKGGVEPSAAAAILHHHQHWDGSGYPTTKYNDGTSATPRESRIHIFARIIAVANLYDRLANSTEGTGRRSNLEVLHLLRTQYAGWCDPTILKMLHMITPPFAPGTMVKLSDETMAVVVDVEPDDPFRPVIKRIVGDDLKLDETRVRLKMPDAPSITHMGKLAVEPYLPGYVGATPALPVA